MFLLLNPRELCVACYKNFQRLATSDHLYPRLDATMPRQVGRWSSEIGDFDVTDTWEGTLSVGNACPAMPKMPGARPKFNDCPVPTPESEAKTTIGSPG